MDTLSIDDTIAALASAPGAGARGIVRLSGPDVRNRLEGLFVPEDARAWNSVRRARRFAGQLRLNGLPVALAASVYLWPGCRSYTGQPLAEIHSVGAPPLLDAVLQNLFERKVRAARPGEFTLRAFLAGRIDLVQAEAVLGVIDSADHRELELALRQLAGGLSSRITQIRSDLIELLADLEAGLDFVDEDIEFVEQSEVAARLAAASERLQTVVDQADTRVQTTGRWRVVLAGLPNAGKSSLFNALVGGENALVSEVRGTTRDYLCAPLNWDGTPVELIDTAGWETDRDDGDGIGQSAQDFRDEQVRQADLILWCRPVDLDQDAVERDQQQAEGVKARNQPLLTVLTKADLGAPERCSDTETNVLVSAHSGIGLRNVIDRSIQRLSSTTSGGRWFVGSTASRCRESLDSAVAALENARAAVAECVGDDIVALEVRDVLDHLARIVGAVYTDDVLDRIFSKFCIGK